MLTTHLFSALTVIASVRGFLTAPNLEELKASNRVHQVARGKKLPGPAAYAKALGKYGKTVPDNVRKAAVAAMNPVVAPSPLASQSSSTSSSSKKTTSTTPTKISTTITATYETASVTATDIGNDLQYLVNVTIGGSRFLLNFDTLSSDLWVFSTLLPAAQRGSHNLYAPIAAKKQAGETWSISYGDGSTYGAIIFPCTSTLPEFSLWMNSVKHTMPGSYANHGTLASPAGYCYGAIQSQGDDPVSVIGDVFLKSQFVVFNYCVGQIGWAQQAGVAV